MNMFKQIEGDGAIVHSNGVYKHASLYSRADDSLWAAWGGGYIRLNSDGTTSKDKVYIDTLFYEGGLFSGKFGRLFINATGKGNINCKQLTTQEVLKLTAG